MQGVLQMGYMVTSTVQRMFRDEQFGILLVGFVMLLAAIVVAIHRGYLVTLGFFIVVEVVVGYTLSKKVREARRYG